MKVLPEIQHKFNKYADKIEDMDYNAVINRLIIIEQNLSEWVKKLKEKFKSKNSTPSTNLGADSMLSYINK